MSQLDLLEQFELYIKASYKGKRTKKNGSRIQTGSIRKIEYTYKILKDFSQDKQFPLRIKSCAKFNNRTSHAEKIYWKKFYRKFTDYLYNDLDCYDNYAGSVIKDIRTFFNYLANERNYYIGNFHKQFYVYKEEIDILTLNPEQLNFVVYDSSFTDSLNKTMQNVKDFLIVGCTVALRYSDLVNLKLSNLEKQNEEYYLKTQSQKTKVYTRIKLPEYVVAIFKKYSKKGNRLLPYFNLVRLNIYLKRLAEQAGWTQEVIKTRQKRGIAKVIYKDQKQQTFFRFCDLMSSHVMRRTAITTMLSLQMPEHLVKKISGHAANSKEFYKYVAISQKHLDTETDKIYSKLQNINRA